MQSLFCFYIQSPTIWKTFEDLFHTSKFRNGKYSLLSRNQLSILFCLPHSFLKALNGNLKSGKDAYESNLRHWNHFFKFFKTGDGAPLREILGAKRKATETKKWKEVIAMLVNQNTLTRRMRMLSY
jgi:hypothetical protein